MGIFNNPVVSDETHTKASQADVDNKDNNSYVTGKTLAESKVIQDLQKHLNLRQDPVYYYSTLAHNNSNKVNFKIIPDSTTPGGFARATPNKLQIATAGIYQITYTDNYKSNDATTFRIRFDETDLVDVMHISDVQLPKSVNWKALNYTITVPILTNCYLNIGLNPAVLDGTANSKLIIYKISDFPSDTIP